MPNPYVVLWFEAPLQSWGADSKFGRRDTQSFPTKSAVLGLVCAAMGAGGEQHDLLAQFSALDQTVISFARAKRKEDVLTKQDKEPLLRDFHMVGSGYDDQDPWMSLLIPKTSEGKKAVGGGAKMTYRYYLQDAAFAVLLEVPVDLADSITSALTSPTWDVYLGRKNCVPTDFIFRGVYSEHDLACAHALEIAVSKMRVEDFRVVQGIPDDDSADDSFTLNDVPIQFGTDKRYRDRQVSLLYAR